MWAVYHYELSQNETQSCSYKCQRYYCSKLRLECQWVWKTTEKITNLKSPNIYFSIYYSSEKFLYQNKLHTFKGHILKCLGTSVRLFEKPFLKVAGFSMDWFVMLMIVLHLLCTLNGKNTTHKNPVNLPCSLGKVLRWDPNNTLKKSDAGDSFTLCTLNEKHHTYKPGQFTLWPWEIDKVGAWDV